MIVLIISDLHIGINDPHNDVFKWDSRDFLRVMDSYIKKYRVEMVILNGDIYELYKYSFEEIKKANPELVDYLQQFYYINGNHDSLCDFGHDFWEHTNSRGETIFIEHGHNVDWRNGSPSGRFIARALYLILKKLVRFKSVRKLYYRVVEWQDQLHRIPRRYDRYKYLNYALKLLLKYDTVILGHTHKQEFVKTYFINKKKRYFNSGTCCHGKFEGMILNTETSFYEFIHPHRDTAQEDEEEILHEVL
jgi:predicted phosphodiesterase